MTSGTIRTILGALSNDTYVHSDSIKAKIDSGEIADVRFACGDYINGIYNTFDTYEDALDAHKAAVKYGAVSAIEVYTTALGEAKCDYEEHGHIDTSNYGIEPHEWLDEAIEDDWGPEEIAKQADKDAKALNWIALVNTDDEDDDDASTICMIY